MNLNWPLINWDELMSIETIWFKMKEFELNWTDGEYNWLEVSNIDLNCNEYYKGSLRRKKRIAWIEEN